MSEKQLWSGAVSKRLKQGRIQAYRVESAGTCPGIPDIHYIVKNSVSEGMTGWIELKSSAQLPTRVPVRPDQVRWHMGYWEAGGNSWILLRAKGLLLMWPGDFADEISKPGGFKKHRHKAWVDGSKKDPATWAAIINCLKRGVYT